MTEYDERTDDGIDGERSEGDDGTEDGWIEDGKRRNAQRDRRTEDDDVDGTDAIVSPPDNTSNNYRP